MKSFSMNINNQTKLLQERIGAGEIQNAKLKTEISNIYNTTKSETGNKNFHGLSLIKKQNDRLRSTVLDLQCQSLSEHLVFMGIPELKDENTESSIKTFIKSELKIPREIDLHTELVKNPKEKQGR